MVVVLYVTGPNRAAITGSMHFPSTERPLEFRNSPAIVLMALPMPTGRMGGPFARAVAAVAKGVEIKRDPVVLAGTPPPRL